MAAFATNYERMTGGCTRLIAAEIVSTVQPPITNESHILDNACGPGIAAQEVQNTQPGARITCADLSPQMLEQVQQRFGDQAETKLLDVRDLKGLPDDSFTHVVTNLGFPVPDDPDSLVKGAKEMFRALKVGGAAVVSTWSDRVWPSAYLATAKRIRPQQVGKNAMALPLEQMTASWLVKQMEEAGFGNNVAIRPYVTYTSGGLDELIDNMMLAKGMFFPGFTEEELERVKPIFREELQKCRTFELLGDGTARIGMKAWILSAWKMGDEQEVPL